ncbi:MAG TPA: ATP-binding protein [Thermoanaerobaculia bacterium]|nr:ATP-binding protein [Thermoanaerobaculia bacterium]
MKPPGTLVARLAWWFAVSLLALYGIPATLVYVYASAQARQYAVLTLKSEAEALAAYVAESGSLDAPELRASEEAPIPMWLRVLRDSTVLAQTPGTPKLPPPPALVGNGAVVEVSFLSTQPPYVVVRHEVGGPTPGLRVEAIGSMEPLQRSKRRLGLGLLLVGFVVIPLAAMGGRALAQRALRPIGDLVEAIQGLDPDRREGRLHLPGSVVEEVAVLSRAFNVLLGQLEESVQRMRRFTADASHEIRNPLSVLRTGLEIALRRERTPSDYQALLRENLQEIDRLHAVVEGILLLARDVPGSELRLASAPVDLGDVVRATTAFFAGSAAESEIRIDAHLEPDLVISGDAGLLRLVVFNLLDNAVKHSPKGEIVRIEARREDGAVILRIADHGPGVRPEDRDRVFERFFRGGPASGTGVGGIGLSVVRWVAEAHGGSARLLDTDKGAAFEVRLPG